MAMPSEKESGCYNQVSLTAKNQFSRHLVTSTVIHCLFAEKSFYYTFANAQKGDFIGIFVGARVPFLIRVVPSEKTLRLVGPASMKDLFDHESIWNSILKRYQDGLEALGLPIGFSLKICFLFFAQYRLPWTTARRMVDGGWLMVGFLSLIKWFCDPSLPLPRGYTKTLFRRGSRMDTI